VSWNWIFFLNVPVGAATLALGARAIPADTASPVLGARRHLDIYGLITSALALFPLTYGLIEGQRRGWTSPLIVGAFVVAAVAAVAFGLIESRQDDPMVDVSLFRDRVFAGGSAALVMWGFGLFGIYFFTSLYLQNILHFSPTVAGSAFVPMAVLMAAGATISNRVAARIGAYRSVGLAMGLMAVGIASATLLGTRASFLDLMAPFALIGIGGGLTIPLTSTMLSVMPPERAGVASGIFNASREIAGLLGVTVIGAILSARETARLHAGHTATAAFMTGYRTGLLVAASLVAAGGVAAWVSLRHLRPQAAATVPGEPAAQPLLARAEL
jgi:predicted MFS family arabinose efflux permease